MSRLDEIVAYKQEELKALKQERSLSVLEKGLKHRPPVRSFRASVHREGELSLIAEIKRASPSAGPIKSDVDPVALARLYAGSGANAISVLTDEKFFSGKLRELTAVKEAVGLPVLRKDFTLEEYQIVEGACAGADCVLLIVAILEPKVLVRLLQLAQDFSIDALTEIHTERELKTALECGADLIGINNRDLNTFAVDLETTKALGSQVPEDRTWVAESGLRSAQDVAFVRAQGAHAVLIGEELMVAEDPGARIEELMKPSDVG